MLGNIPHCPRFVVKLVFTSHKAINILRLGIRGSRVFSGKIWEIDIALIRDSILRIKIFVQMDLERISLIGNYK